MDAHGAPTHLFTTDRWVTGETFFAAADAIRMLDRFAIDHADPSWPTNRWLTAMVRLFRPQIAQLLRERDATILRRSAETEDDPLEDRSVEITSMAVISVEGQMEALEAALGRLRGGPRRAY